MRILLLIAAAAVIIGSIAYLEFGKPARPTPGNAEIVLEESPSAPMPAAPSPRAVASSAPEPRRMSPAEKAARYPRAKELVGPAGFLNAEPFTLRSLVGNKVILVDFWTYSCINCQRTTPYLNSWYQTYRAQGLEIVGVHTPEFQFEHKYENVKAAIEKFKIRYPVVQDNAYATWTAYGNRYWPRKYLIDIDGFIVYDHIGEGAYEETEKKIRELLTERMAALGLPGSLGATATPEGALAVDFRKVESPEVYFGALRNELLGNGVAGRAGPQSFTAPAEMKLNTLYLAGDWTMWPEFAEARGAPAKIVFRYRAKDVYFVAAAERPVRLRILRDGAPLSSAARGEDVRIEKGEATFTVQEERLYKVIQDTDDYGEHTLELLIEGEGLRAFTFTFG